MHPHPTLRALRTVLVAPAFTVLVPFAAAQATRPALPAPNVSAAQTAAPATATIQALARADADQVLFDEPGDGSLWARGNDYKVSFDAEGATFFPRFGPRAPHDFAHRLSPDRVTSGGAPLALSGASTHARHGERVELDRGSFVEAYDLGTRSLEQTFVFDTLPSRGALELHIPVASELDGASKPEGLEFRGEFGGVSYGRASVIDARGQHVGATTELENGAITIRIGAEALAGAVLPLVIDPVVSSTNIDSTTSDTYSSDVAWDPGQGVWLVVYEQTYSATDTDVYAKILSASGTVLLSGTVDFTSIAWHNPRCADMAGSGQFLVVAEVGTAGATTIKARTVQPNGTLLTVGAQFDISPLGQGNQLHPEVGGDPYPGLPSYWCVAYEEALGSNDAQVAYQMVNSSGALSGARVILPHTAGTPDRTPTIAKSDDTSEWLLAWMRVNMFTFSDIYAAHVGWSGGLIDGPFVVTSSTSFDFTPCASSQITGTQRGAIAFTRRVVINGDTNIMVAALDGTTVLQVFDMTAAENSGRAGVSQIEPTIDCDGQHFLVGYGELDDFYTTFYDIFVSDLYLAGNQFGIAQAHDQLSDIGLSERRARITAQHSTSAHSHRYLAMYDIEGNSTDHDVYGQLYDALEGGAWSLACNGSGSPTACPCGNSGAGARGCANSVVSVGALLTRGSGSPSTLNDTFVLEASSMPSSATCIFLQGSAVVSATPFGDGLRCVGGTLIRLGVKAASSGIATYPQAGDPSISVRGGVPANGGTFGYQTYYRDPASFCTSLTYNITNSVMLSWAK